MKSCTNRRRKVHECPTDTTTDSVVVTSTLVCGKFCESSYEDLTILFCLNDRIIMEKYMYKKINFLIGKETGLYVYQKTL